MPTIVDDVSLAQRQRLKSCKCNGRKGIGWQEGGGEDDDSQAAKPNAKEREESERMRVVDDEGASRVERWRGKDDALSNASLDA